MSQTPDDLEAVRTIAKALEAFEHKDQERIIRWAREKLGLPPYKETAVDKNQTGTEKIDQSGTGVHSDKSGLDIKGFINLKNPQSDNQLAATIAYYYRYEAPEAERKQAITKDDLQNTCRLANIERLNKPTQTLVNAHHAGLFDKGPERGTYVLNSVGENLVAMTLPLSTKLSVPKKVKSRKLAKK